MDAPNHARRVRRGTGAGANAAGSGPHGAKTVWVARPDRLLGARARRLPVASAQTYGRITSHGLDPCSSTLQSEY